MKTQRWAQVLATGAAVSFGMAPSALAAQEYPDYSGYQGYEAAPLEARIWLDRGDEPVLRRGDQVRIYYRVSEGAFVAIFHIDSNGTARMIFPNAPQENHYARGGRDYRVLFPGSSSWFVNDDPGMGYYFIVASPEPFDFTTFRYSHFNGGWDLGFVGRQVYGDPYLAMDDYVAALIPDWEYVGYALDFTAYHVDGHYDYPRFLCYDCHGFLPYRSWNPYHYSCSSFRVVIYNDPYFYPVSRYRGTRVVYVQPQRGIAHFTFKERAVGEPGTPQLVSRVQGGGNAPGVAGTETRRAVPRGSSTGAVAPGASTGRVAVPPGQARPGVEGTTTRRPGSAGGDDAIPLTRPSRVLPGGSTGASTRTATPPASARPGTGGTVTPPAQGRTATPTRPGGADRPVLERRPAAGGGSSTPPTTPPTATRPTAKVRPGSGGGGAVTSPPRGGSSGGSVSPTRGSVGSSSAGRTTVGGSGSTTTSRSLPTTRSTPPARSGGSGAVRSTPPARSGGSGAVRSTPPARSGGSGAARSTPPARSGGSGAVRSTPPARSTSSGGGGSTARTTKPPPKRPPGGGGG